MQIDVPNKKKRVWTPTFLLQMTIEHSLESAFKHVIDLPKETERTEMLKLSFDIAPLHRVVGAAIA